MRHLPLFLLSALLFTLAGCAKEVGDECNSDAECGAGRICDQSSKGGYCTVSPCQPSTCPEESVCVEFENEETYCMRLCESTEDCRSHYICTNANAPVNYCRQSG